MHAFDRNAFQTGMLLIILTSIAGYLLGPIEVRYLNRLTDNPLLIGVTYALSTLAYASSAVWLGRLSDRIGRRKAILSGLILEMITPILFILSSNIYIYMIVKILGVWGSILSGPIIYAYVQDVLKHVREQGAYMSRVYAAQSILGAGASILSGYLSDTYTLTTPYLAAAGVLLTASILAAVRIKHEPPPPSRPREKRNILFSIQYIRERPPLVFYFITNTIFGINWGSKGILYPLAVYTLTGKDLATGSIFASMGITAFLILLFIGRVIDRIGPFTSAFISMSILGTGGIIIGTAEHASIFWLGAIITAIGEAINGPMEAVLLTRYVENQYRGEIIGFDTLTDTLLGMLTPILIGSLLNHLTPQAILLILTSLYWIGLASTGILYTRHIWLREDS